MRIIRTLAVAATLVLGAASATPAAAWTLVNWDGSKVWGATWDTSYNDKTSPLRWTAADAEDGVWYRVYFAGITDDYMKKSEPLPGLRSTVLYRLKDVSENALKPANQDWTFEYVVENWSGSRQGYEDVKSRVSAIGFNVYPDEIGRVALSGEYDNAQDGSTKGAGNAGFGAVDVCLTDGNNCSGGKNGGVFQGSVLNGVYQPGTGSGAFTLTFTGAPAEVVFSNPYVRYQSLSFGKVSGSSGIGVPQAWVPEPATWAMMIVGFGAAGAMLRRRRTLAAG